ncbi:MULTISPECIES: hypothetical protein [Pseudomonas]|uniref:hypothetical protein n=1 Tax=Pseudomonas TaxID=286 RepID=UPI0002703F11|nr:MULTISPECIES: hypothetical protein [Pseudomonas]EJM27829.1 hypothetical protein PMI24_02865 [Pseudomonas sp. GM25]MCU0089468.1 hypothetical protein [Pseudomonas koreensis]
MSQPPLVINLSSSGTGKFDERNDILQRDALKRLDSLIVEQVNGISDYSEDNYAKVKETSLSYSRTHNAMLIQGGRGSGKTTFLLNALHRLNTPQKLDKPDEADIAKVANQLHVLPMIDPTLVETKENIIIVILSMIEAAIADVKDERGKLEEARQALAEGLGLLDGIGPNSAYGNEWEEATWVMSRGLHKAKKGRSFELKFGVYLETALSLLNHKKAFVLAFDDVDTNFNHGHTILETIRKYLTSPRLVLLLSGDLDLYGRLLRRNIYNTFGEQVLKYDPNIIGKDKHNLSHAVLELEEQYLLKIVPPQNRIPMLPLGGIMQRSGVSVKTSVKEESGQDLAQWANEQIRKLLLDKEGQSQSFFDFVSMEHLRLVIGYLQALNQDDKKSCRQMILKVFETRLRTSQVPTDLIERGNFDYALRSAFDWLINQDDAPDLLEFGVPVDPVRAVVLHCLALSLAQGIESHNGGPLRALFALALPITMMRRPENVERDIRSSVFRFLWTNSSPSLPEIAARIGTIDRSRRQEIGKIPGSSFGSVGLTHKLTQKESLLRVYGLIDPVKSGERPTMSDLNDLNGSDLDITTANWVYHLNNAEYGDLQIRQSVSWFSIDDLIQERSGKFSEVLRLIVYKRFSARGEMFRSLSALSLFAVIGDLLMSNEIGDLTSHAVSATIPPFKREKTQDELSLSTEAVDEQGDEEPKEEESATAIQDDKHFDKFMKNLEEWHVFACDERLNAAVSPALLGSIASRIHDDLMDLDEKVTSSWKSGQILHRQITNILHGILVLTSGLPGRKESPKVSDRPLREALGRIQGTRTDVSLHPLAIIVLSCPLVWAFLNPYDDDNHEFWATNPLRTTALEALKNWRDSQTAKNIKASSNFDNWLKPPTIRIKIGPIVQSANQRSVELDGFYDVLNVVPRNVTK